LIEVKRGVLGLPPVFQSPRPLVDGLVCFANDVVASFGASNVSFWDRGERWFQLPLAIKVIPV